MPAKRANAAEGKPARARDGLVELRGMYPRALVETLDMIAMAKGRTRTDLVGHVLAAYAATKQHEASLVSRTPRVNPPEADSDWSPLE